MLNFEGYAVPEHTKSALENYVEKGLPTGDFLKCVLSNNFVGAVARADHENFEALQEIAMWMYNEAPQACWGNEAKYLRWLQDHRNLTK